MQVWEMITDERRELADVLDGLMEPQWLAPSAVDGWRVRDVAAHLVWALENSLPKLALHVALGGFNLNAVMDKRALGDVRPGQELVAQLRRFAGKRSTPPGATVEMSLAEIVVHSLDVRAPLGLPLALAPERARIVLDTLVSPLAARGFAPKRLPKGLRYEATDLEWSHGAGPTVLAPAGALALALMARPRACAGLGGDGAEPFRAQMKS